VSDLPHVLLDRSGDAIVPDGYVVLNGEVEFLVHCLDQVPIIIRGDSVCRWAETFCRVRDIRYTYVKSPVDELCSLCSGLPQDDAKALLNAIGDHWHKLQNVLSLISVLEATLPNGHWKEQPSRMHAARWLLWIDSNDIPSYLAPIVRAQAKVWSDTYRGPERLAYEATNREEAETILSEWLGLSDINHRELGTFPLPVTERWLGQTKARWSFELLKQGCNLFTDLVGKPVTHQLLQQAANLVYTRLKDHPEELTEALALQLQDYLPSKFMADLWRRIPPTDPGDVPDDPVAVVEWYVSGYLPFRRWQVDCGNSDARDRVTSLAKQFALWYLAFYAECLSGGSGKKHLCMDASSALRAEEKNDVLLWVVLDGLHTLDAAELLRLLRGNCQRLTKGNDGSVFGTLPTITQFAKPSLLTGLPPALITDVEGTDAPFCGFIRLQENRDPSEVLGSAEKGSKYLWLLSEPDKTYHRPYDRPTILAEVQTQLQTIADRLIKAAEAVPEHLLMKIVISTDHGRLLGGGQRLCAIPTGMQAHGRAAFGEINREYTASGYYIDPDSEMVYLSSSRFGTSDDCAVVLTENAFVTSDCKTGTEQFPHGGMFPEEVILPWIELHRDATAPLVRITVAGKALAQKPGSLEITVENPEERTLVLDSVQITTRDRTIMNSEFHMVIQAQSTQKVQEAVSQWPSKSEIAEARAVAYLSLPNGLKFKVDATMTIVSEEMYTRDSILEDLL